MNNTNMSVRFTDKITLFASKRASDILHKRLSDKQLTDDFKRFILVQFERIRQFIEKHNLGTQEELQLAFLRDYQTEFISIYNELKK